MIRTLTLLYAAIIISTASALAAPAWKEVNMGWEKNCGDVEMDLRGGNFIFRTHKNCWTTGVFTQRSEIISHDIPVQAVGDFHVKTRLSLQSKSGEPAIVFQIHDGRQGCSPPLSVRWRQNGVLTFDSDYTKGKGLKGCRSNLDLRQAIYFGPTLKRDGTNYDFDAYVSMDGKGGFEVEIKINGKTAIGGTFSQLTELGFVKSTRFHFKHGVYSPSMFNYEFKSSGMKTYRATRGTHIFSYKAAAEKKLRENTNREKQEVLGVGDRSLCMFALDRKLNAFSNEDSRKKYVIAANQKGLTAAICAKLLSE